MTGSTRHHHHDRDSAALPLSVMAQSAMVRLVFTAALLVVLWLAVLWAVALP